MIRKFTLSLLALLGVFSAAMAQHCGFDQKHQQRMSTDPVYASSVNQYNAWWAANAALLNNALPVTLPNGKFAYEIPVVVHVMYTNEKPQYNVSSTLIQNTIDYLNQSYQATYASYPDTQSGGTRIPLVFKLAARTPNCAPTTGINYFDLTSNAAYYQWGMDHGGGNGVSEAALKAMSFWNRDLYCNIWIVNKLDGADGYSPGPYTGGFAWLPPGPAALDGIVMIAKTVTPGDITLPHEMAHYFNLRHVFEGGSTTVCPGNVNCNAQGDFICDTEPQRQSQFNCPSAGSPTPVNPCTGVAYTNGPNNFMDYSNCQNRFTPGQRTRMMAALQQLRPGLMASLGAVPPNATPLPTVCVPTMPVPPTGGGSQYGPRDIEISRDNFQNKIFDVTSSGYTGDANQHYIDNTCKNRVELTAGIPHQMRLTWFPNTSRIRVYIDYNNNGSFTDAGENIYTADGTNSPDTAVFTPPTTGAVYCIPLRMRVTIDNQGPLALGPCTPLNVGQAEDYEVIIRGATNNNLTGLVDLSINPLHGNPSCAGTTAEILSTVSTTITPVWYKWYIVHRPATPLTEGPSSATATTWSQNTWITDDSVYLKVAYVGLCGIDTAISDTIIFNRPPTILPSVAIGTPSAACPDEDITLGISSVVNNGGSTYQWYKNGSPISAATGASYVIPANSHANGDQYRLHMIFPPSSWTVCNDSTPLVQSNIVQITHTSKVPTASISLTSGTNPGCAGQLLTFTATGTTLGSAPTYAWFVNGSPAGTNSPSFTSVFNNNDVVTVQITSSSSCAIPSSATSTGTTITQQLVTADVSIVQVSGGNPACSGHPVVFSATPVNSGPAPQFQWLINNTPVIGANTPVFNTTSLVNGDVVQCVLISTDPCVVNTLDTSNAVQMNVTPSKVPKVTFTLTKGNNPGCLDSLVEFTATATDAGTNPIFEWLVNNFELNLNNTVYSSTNLLNNDIVICRIVPTDGQCYLPDTGYSAPVTMVRSPTPQPPIISLVHNMLITNKNGSFVWFGPGGQLTGGDDGKFHPGELGEYFAVTNNNGCWSKPSNRLTITLLDINEINEQTANIYPNPTTGKLTIDWGRKVNATVAIYSTVGQKLAEENAAQTTTKVLDLSHFANGLYFVVITDENGKSSTTRITLAK